MIKFPDKINTLYRKYENKDLILNSIKKINLTGSSGKFLIKLVKLMQLDKDIIVILKNSKGAYFFLYKVLDNKGFIYYNFIYCYKNTCKHITLDLKYIQGKIKDVSNKRLFNSLLNTNKSYVGYIKPHFVSLDSEEIKNLITETIRDNADFNIQKILKKGNVIKIKSDNCLVKLVVKFIEGDIQLELSNYEGCDFIKIEDFINKVNKRLKEGVTI